MRNITAALLATLASVVLVVPLTSAAERLHAPDQVKAPVKTVNVNPVYPSAARDAKIEGIVILDVVIGEDGSIVTTKIVRSVPELDQAAIDAVVQWKYEPTLLNGAPVEVEMFVTVNFTLS